MIKAIDLNVITTEDELLPIMKSILRNESVILLKNYANMETLRTLSGILANDSPDDSVGFDRNFVGCTKLENGISVEQFIGSADSVGVQNSALSKLSSRLVKIAIFFARACLAAVNVDKKEIALDERHSTVKVTRYHKPISKSMLDLEFDYEDEYVLHNSSGIITVFPVAHCVQFKQHGKWTSLQEPNSILIQTGTLLSQFSNGMHASDSIKISTTNTTHLTIFPALESSVNGQSVSRLLLLNQLQEFPQDAEVLYPKEMAQQNLAKRVGFCKDIFNVTDSVMSLYCVSRSLTSSNPGLDKLLPQISNMLKRKVSQDDFLRMMHIWDEAYMLEVGSDHEITVGLPSSGLLNTLTNKSRKLRYTELADKWLSDAVLQPQVLTNVPALKIRKRRSSSTFDIQGGHSRDLQTPRALAQPKKNRTNGYIANTKEKFMFKELSNNENGESLLERIREKERRAAALLSQRERQYEQFLNIKTFQVFDILNSLTPDRPYTATHLISLIVDSLVDSNNPIGERETYDILLRLQTLLKDRIKIIEAEGSLKVFRWPSLDRLLLEERIKDSNEQLLNG
ncbi:LAQU0S03e01970g1_1 [Lachancea quebecensis]|uniref:LAQU0S03e01970g1_1 n=1 Tax=Lachancea quebecensis TaxID=1654605 RepID=A0A0P1KP72_9SACH|nr:LAQU0S03e01970g1_1 [Lachancea quebecensis]